MPPLLALQQNDDAVAAAVKWVADGLLGPAATSIAVLAIGALGLAMLWGRFDLRSAGKTVLGAFILFGAPLIAYELMQSRAAREIAVPEVTQVTPAAPPPSVPKNAPANDPYAGAAVPQLQ